MENLDFWKLESEEQWNTLQVEGVWEDKNKLYDKPGARFPGAKQCGDQQTDRQTDQPTDEKSYRGACSRLKIDSWNDHNKIGFLES